MFIAGVKVKFHQLLLVLKESTIEAIKKKGKEFKSKMADEAKKAQEAEFKKKPWKDPKKEWDQALREYVEKKK